MKHLISISILLFALAGCAGDTFNPGDPASAEFQQTQLLRCLTSNACTNTANSGGEDPSASANDGGTAGPTPPPGYVYTAHGSGMGLSTDSGTSFSLITTANGLVDNNTRGLYVDADGILVGTISGTSYSQDNGTSYSTIDPGNTNTTYRANSVIYLGQSTGGLLISTDNGASFTQRTTADGLVDNNVNSIFVDGSNLYVATANGLSISTDGGVSFVNRTMADGIGDDILYGVHASGSTIYVATFGGFSISTDGGVSFVNRTTADGLGANAVRGGLAVVGGIVYAGTQSGLSISTDGGASFVNRTTADGLGSNDIRSLFVTAGGDIYAGTLSGLSISTDGGTSFVNRTTADGLGSNLVRDVFVY